MAHSKKITEAVYEASLAYLEGRRRLPKMQLTTAFEAYGQSFLTVDQVIRMTPLMVCMDGPKKGWVYDDRDIAGRRYDPGEDVFVFGTLRYEYRGEIYRDDEHRILRALWLVRAEDAR